jgi:hypothetical protein
MTEESALQEIMGGIGESISGCGRLDQRAGWMEILSSAESIAVFSRLP